MSSLNLFTILICRYADQSGQTALCAQLLARVLLVYMVAAGKCRKGTKPHTTARYMKGLGDSSLLSQDGLQMAVQS